MGRRAMVYGVVAQSLPDIDFLAAFWLTTTENLLAHRGFTHSILFCILTTIAATLAAMLWHKGYLPLKTWLLLFGTNIFGHIFIDAFNAYGTAWWEPFNHARISFHTLFVADPFFSFIPFIAFLALMILRPRNPRRKLWAGIGIGFSCLYLLYASINKTVVTNDVQTAMANQGIVPDKYLVSPTPLNNWLWFAVAKADSGMYIGHRSVFDRHEAMEFHYFPQNNQLLRNYDDEEEIQRLIRFSQGYYTVEKWGDTLVFNDLRFGQMIGWHEPKERFVFHYFLHPTYDNKLVVQRGRFLKWEKETMESLIRSIQGK